MKGWRVVLLAVLALEGGVFFGGTEAVGQQSGEVAIGKQSGEMVVGKQSGGVAVGKQNGEVAVGKRKGYSLRVAVEWGTNSFFGDLIKPEQIRESQSSGNDMNIYYGDGAFSHDQTLQLTYVGVKPEIFVLDGQIGIAAGLRYSWTSTQLGSERNFFWRRQNTDAGVRTDYIHLQGIRTDYHLIGVPLEIRYFPEQIDRHIQHYLKVGTAFNFSVAPTVSPDFTSPEMHKYADEIASQLPKTRTFSAYTYAAVGCKIGKTHNGRWSPWCNVELQYPCILHSGRPFAFDYNGVSAIGFQISFQIPVGINMPIGSKHYIAD
ncbi:MAG: hypothetical protein LBB27_01780 [Tannerellaceae bacterium]|jgi:hypothetical protein|nr:hypothetical protein [Tannerellaceae bacterium]